MVLFGLLTAGIWVTPNASATMDMAAVGDLEASFISDIPHSIAESPGCEVGEEEIGEWWNFVDETGRADSDVIEACVTDETGAPFDTQFVNWFIEEGPASFVPGWDCEPQDLDGDANGTAEACIGTTTGDVREAEVGPEYDAAGIVIPGIATVTVCVDETDDPNDPRFGCHDATHVERLGKHFSGGPVDVEVVFSTAGMTRVEACRSGTTFRLNETGDRDFLYACTFDFYGNLVSTEVDQVIGSDSEIHYVGDDKIGPVEAVPTETGADGTATLLFAALEVGTAYPGFDLESADGSAF